MNRDDIIRMAREADEGFETDTFHAESLVGMDAIERFAALVAAAERGKYEAKFKQLEAIMQEREQQPNKPCCLAEREVCAKVCESVMPNPVQNWADAQIVNALRDCAAAIRARSNP